MLLGYTQAREMIFIPAYRAAIEQHPGAREAVCLILEMARNGPPVSKGSIFTTPTCPNLPRTTEIFRLCWWRLSLPS